MTSALLVLSAAAGALAGPRLLCRPVPDGAGMQGRPARTAGPVALAGLVAGRAFADHLALYAAGLCLAAYVLAHSAATVAGLPRGWREAAIMVLGGLLVGSAIEPAMLLVVACLAVVLVVLEWPMVLRRVRPRAWTQPFWAHWAGWLALVLLAVEGAGTRDPATYVYTGFRQAPARLAAALDAPDADVRRSAAEQAIRLWDPALLRILRGRLGDSDAGVRRRAARALQTEPEGLSFAALADAARRETDPDARVEILSLLGGRPEPGALPLLVAALPASQPTVREEAALALGRLRDPRAVPALIPVLQDPDGDVRWTVIWALGRHTDPRARAALAAATRATDVTIRNLAHDALLKMDRRAGGPQLVAQLRAGSEAARRNAANRLADLDDERALPALAHALSDRSPAVRESALSALDTIDAPRAIPAIAAAGRSDPNLALTASLTVHGLRVNPFASERPIEE